MSDYRFQVVEHNAIPCLHVMIDGAEQFDGFVQTYIPLDDIQKAIAKSYTQMIIESFARFFEISPLTGQVIQSVQEEEN